MDPMLVCLHLCNDFCSPELGFGKSIVREMSTRLRYCIRDGLEGVVDSTFCEVKLVDEVESKVIPEVGPEWRCRISFKDNSGEEKLELARGVIGRYSF